MNTKLLLVKSVRRLRHAGLRRTLTEGFRLLFRRRAAEEFDFKYGTDTGGIVPLWSLRTDSPNAQFGAKYQTIDEAAMIDAIRFLGDEPGGLTFLDLGSGKGRALLVASELGFKEIIGVEFCRELVEISRQNIGKLGARAVVWEGDAAEYRFSNNPLALYMFNPFSVEVMRAVLAHLMEAKPLKLYIIYCAPLPSCVDLFSTCGSLAYLGCPPGRPDIQVWRSPCP